MTPDELLRLHPRETLRWLRGRVGMSQEAFAWQLRVSQTTQKNWEMRRHSISDEHRAQLAALLAPHLATSEGRAFVRALDEEG